ncbi:MAG TPA: hypothetical protein DCY20_00800 [Firmicutes bacterium]|nr:hypothetical protein [Bacillota bacterium]
MKQRFQFLLILPLCLISITSHAQTNTNLTSIKYGQHTKDETVVTNFNVLLQQSVDPTVLTTYINKHIQQVTNETAYHMVKDLVQSLKNYKQALYQKLDQPLTQKALITQFPNHIEKSDLNSIENTTLRHLLTNDIYNKGFTLNLIHGQYVPVINEQELEKYYLFLTPAQIQSIRVSLAL